MRKLVQNTPMRFRADDRLIAAARDRAAQEGTSFSAVVRRALERDLGLAA